jgi:predicted nuclease of predicted toxin-antitoxin system
LRNAPQATTAAQKKRAVSCCLRDLDLREAQDPEIFKQARNSGVVVMTKDEDFVRLVERNGSPPRVIWVTSGNMSNAHFQSLLLQTFPDAKSLIEGGATVVEISGRKP